MKFGKIPTVLIAAAVAALGISMMLRKTPEAELSEEKCESVICLLDGIESADVMISEKDGVPVGAAVICKGGTSDDELEITKLIKSLLGLPSNRIFVSCK